MNRSEEMDQSQQLPNSWAYVSKDYEILEIIGQGAFGQVARAKSRSSGKTYAIKMIQNVFHSSYETKKILREI